MQTYDPHRNCPKCGGSATIKYDPANNLMRRRCVRCGHQWPELPLDHPGDVTLPQPQGNYPSPIWIQNWRNA